MVVVEENLSEEEAKEREGRLWLESIGKERVVNPEFQCLFIKALNWR